MDDELSKAIDDYNSALDKLSPVVERRLHTYNRHVEIAIIQSWRHIPNLVRRIQTLEKALEKENGNA